MQRIQLSLEQFYGLDASPDVREFVRQRDDDGREELLVRQTDDDVEVALLLPAALLELGALTSAEQRDVLMQAYEGVSHFVFLAERVRMGLPTTLLELELQAEVDKFVLLALEGPGLDAPARHAVCETLFEHVRFVHQPHTEHGVRYRLANTLAARYVRRLTSRRHARAWRRELTQFYRAGQTDKIRLAQAA